MLFQVLADVNCLGRVWVHADIGRTERTCTSIVINVSLKIFFGCFSNVRFLSICLIVFSNKSTCFGQQFLWFVNLCDDSMTRLTFMVRLWRPQFLRCLILWAMISWWTSRHLSERFPLHGFIVKRSESLVIVSPKNTFKGITYYIEVFLYLLVGWLLVFLLVMLQICEANNKRSYLFLKTPHNMQFT